MFHARAKIFNDSLSRDPPDKSSYIRNAAGIFGLGPGVVGEGHPCTLVPNSCENAAEVTCCAIEIPWVQPIGARAKFRILTARSSSSVLVSVYFNGK